MACKNNRSGTTGHLLFMRDTVDLSRLPPCSFSRRLLGELVRPCDVYHGGLAVGKATEASCRALSVTVEIGFLKIGGHRC